MDPYLVSKQEQRLGSPDSACRSTFSLPDFTAKLKSTPAEYCGEKEPPDGEIYFKLRQCQPERNECSKKHWLPRLSRHGFRDNLGSCSIPIAMRTSTKYYFHSSNPIICLGHSSTSRQERSTFVKIAPKRSLLHPLSHQTSFNASSTIQ